MGRTGKVLAALAAVCLLALSACGENVVTQRLRAPRSLRLDDNVLIWEAVEDAEGYVVKFEGREEWVLDPRYIPPSLGNGSYRFGVKAVGNGELWADSAYTYLDFEITDAPVLRVEGGQLRWERDEGARYEYRVDGGDWRSGENYANLSAFEYPEGSALRFDVRRVEDDRVSSLSVCRATVRWGEQVRHTYVAQFGSIVGETIVPEEEDKLFLGWRGESGERDDCIAASCTLKAAFSPATEVLTLRQEEGGWTVAGFAESAPECSALYLPKTVNGLAVKRVGWRAFAGWNSIRYLHVPSGVEEIGMSAFFGCQKLAAIDVPQTVETVGEWAFRDTEWLLTQEDGAVYVGGVCYYRKGTLPEEELVVREGTVTINDSVFADCTELVSASFPASLKRIGKKAFADCGITSARFSEGLTTIEEHAFLNSKLENIDIPDSVEYVGEKAFASTPWLAAQPDGVVYAGNVVYEYKGEMPENTVLALAEGVKMVAPYAFKGLANLIKVTLPDSLLDLGRGAFSGCTNLSEVTVGDGLTHVGAEAFSRTPWWDSRPDGLVVAGNALLGVRGTPDKWVIIEDGRITLIADGALSGISNRVLIALRLPVPPRLGEGVFAAKYFLIVPDEYEQAYLADPAWQELEIYFYPSEQGG